MHFFETPTLLHSVNERRSDTIDSERGESKSEDPVSGIGLEIIGHLVGNTEGGLGDNELILSNTSETDSVLPEDSSGISGSVLNGEGLSVLHEGRRLGRVESGMRLADSGRSAGRSGNPEVSRSGVENDDKGLVRSSDGDISDVFEVSVVQNLENVHTFRENKNSLHLREIPGCWHGACSGTGCRPPTLHSHAYALFWRDVW